VQDETQGGVEAQVVAVVAVVVDAHGAVLPWGVRIPAWLIFGNIGLNP
jgi:hypothetical protein